MRIAFWSNYPCSGVTSNMICLGAAMTLLYKAKIILTSNHHSMRDLGRSLTGNSYSNVVKEANPHFRNRDFFYPFQNDKDSRLKLFIDSTGRYIPNGLSPNEPENGLYYYFFEKQYSDYLYEVNFIDSFDVLVDKLEEQGEFVLMDLQSQGSYCTLQELERADLVVVSLRQEERAISNFFKRYESLAGKSVFLLSEYKKDASYLKKDLINDYHIHPERVAVIPYNRDLASGFADGRMLPYICEYINCKEKCSEYSSMWYIKRAAAILMQTLENGLYSSKTAI